MHDGSSSIHGHIHMNQNHNNCPRLFMEPFAISPLIIPNKSRPMGEKDSKSGAEKKADGGKKDDGPNTVVLKVDLHCEGCSKKVKRSIKKFEGVENVKADTSSGKLTVTGNVDATKLRERVEQKTKNKVEILSPLPKKDKDDGGDKKPAEKKPDEKKADEKKPDEKKPEKKPDEKKPKEAQVSTIVLKIRLHCDGCIQKIRRIISKFKGVQEVSVDKPKDLVTVKGTMDLKDLVPYLKEKLNRSVDIIPAKKDDGGGGEKKEKDGGGDKKEKGGGSGGEKKDGDAKAAGGGGDGGKKEEPVKVEVNKMEYHPFEYGYGYGYGYGPEQGHMQMQMQGQGQGQGYGYAVDYTHAPQIFSDENPNACSVM